MVQCIFSSFYAISASKYKEVISKLEKSITKSEKLPKGQKIISGVEIDGSKMSISTTCKDAVRHFVVVAENTEVIESFIKSVNEKFQMKWLPDLDYLSVIDMESDFVKNSQALAEDDPNLRYLKLNWSIDSMTKGFFYSHLDKTGDEESLKMETRDFISKLKNIPSNFIDVEVLEIGYKEYYEQNTKSK